VIFSVTTRSAADGHTTIFGLLEGRYMSPAIRRAYRTQPIFRPLVQVSLGVARDLSAEPHALTFPLPTPAAIAGEVREALAVLLWEHDVDMARLGGFPRDTASARTAGQEAVRRWVLHRLPWLLLGLAGAFVAADIVGAFEAQLQGRVILAFFLPGVVYLADAVGTQTEALVIRGLSVGVPIGRVVFRELLTGLLMGLALALAFAPIALWRWGQADVVLAVALSLLAACSIATVIATSLPWLLRRLGLDPAFSSGPLATVVQDLLSILHCFLISVALVAEGT
jgi:magnesium transporter